MRTDSVRATPCRLWAKVSRWACAWRVMSSRLWRGVTTTGLAPGSSFHSIGLRLMLWYSLESSACEKPASTPEVLRWNCSYVMHLRPALAKRGSFTYVCATNMSVCS